MKADSLRGPENQGDQHLLPEGRKGTAQGSQRRPCKASMYAIQHAQLQGPVTHVCGWECAPSHLVREGENQSEGQMRAGESG